MKLQHICLITLLSLTSLPLQAEVYKWTDADGKVHFGDKKATDAGKQQAEDVSATLKPVNIDHDSKARASDAREHSRDAGGKNIDEMHYQENQQLRQALSDQYHERQQEHCKKLKKEMQWIADGTPVDFKDADGNSERVMNSERGEKLKQWQAAYEDSGCTSLEEE